MILRLLHRILLVVAVFITVQGTAMAQNSDDNVNFDDYDIIAIRGIERTYSVEVDEGVIVHWQYIDSDGVLISIDKTGPVIRYAFDYEGDCKLMAVAEDKETKCKSVMRTAKIYVHEAGFEVTIDGKDRACEYDVVTLTANVVGLIEGSGIDDLNFEWYGLGVDGATTQTVEVSAEFADLYDYGVEVTDRYGNTIYADITIQVDPVPIIEFPENPVIIVEGEIAILYLEENFSSYEWFASGNDDKPVATTDEIQVTDHGKYWVTVTNDYGCSSTDTVNVYYEDEVTRSGLIATVPSAFSPNADGVNDLLKVRGSLDRLKTMSLTVYRRDGLKMFETTNPSEGWDGTFDGVKQNVDGYVYFLKVVFDNDEVLNRRGSVSLLK